LPDLLASFALAAHQPGLCERVQMLGDGLPRYLGAFGEAHDGLRTARAEAGDDVEARLVAEGGGDRGGLGELLCGGGARARHAQWSSQLSACFARYFARSSVWAVQPCSFISKALARRSMGMLSNPDSVMVSLVPPGTSSSSKEINVVGSPE